MGRLTAETIDEMVAGGESIASIARSCQVDRKTIRRWRGKRENPSVYPPSMSTIKHLYVPDPQIRVGVPVVHLDWLAMYALDKGPDRIIIGGDWWDFPSLSSYDKPGSKKTAGQTLASDLRFPSEMLHKVCGAWEKRGYRPKIDFTEGNHENRFHRAVADNPRHLDGIAGEDPMGRKGLPITFHGFLDPVDIDGIRYAHFFPHNSKGKVMQTKNGAPSAYEQTRRQMCSATAGHQQGLDTAIVPTSAGMRRGLIAGSFYLHDEEYVGPASLNRYWRGLILKHQVRDGEYGLCEVGMDFLRDRYGWMTL